MMESASSEPQKKRHDGVKLSFNADKTHLIEFGRFAKSNREQRGVGKPKSFDFLSFTHICSIRRENGYTSLQMMRTEVARGWIKAMRRRSQKGSNFNWLKMQRWINRFSPHTRVRHLYPNQRFHL
jgi:hypothetical protein